MAFNMFRASRGMMILTGAAMAVCAVLIALVPRGLAKLPLELKAIGVLLCAVCVPLAYAAYVRIGVLELEASSLQITVQAELERPD